MAKDSIGNISGVGADLAANTNPEQGRSVLSNLFGGNQSGVVSAISRYAGLKDSSVSSLMSMGLPVILGILGRHAEQNNLTAGGLSGFLSSQYNNIVAAIPAELSSLNNMADFDSIRHGKRKAKSTEKTTVTKTINEMVAAGTYKEGRSRGMKWLLASALIIVVILIIWYFTKG